MQTRVMPRSIVPGGQNFSSSQSATLLETPPLKSELLRQKVGRAPTTLKFANQYGTPPLSTLSESWLCPFLASLKSRIDGIVRHFSCAHVVFSLTMLATTIVSILLSQVMTQNSNFQGQWNTTFRRTTPYEVCKAKDCQLLNSINSPCLYSARQPKDYSSSDTKLLLELPIWGRA